MLDCNSGFELAELADSSALVEEAELVCGKIMIDRSVEYV